MGNQASKAGQKVSQKELIRNLKYPTDAPSTTLPNLGPTQVKAPPPPGAPGSFQAQFQALHQSQQRNFDAEDVPPPDDEFVEGKAQDGLSVEVLTHFLTW
jgi:hypothetical protein